MLIRDLDKEKPKDKDKRHYQFWEDVEKSPIGKANRWLNQGASFDTSPEDKQLYRSGEKGKVLQGLQYTNDLLDVTQTVAGLPVQALGWTFDTVMEGLSDATGYDKRSLNTALTIAGLSKAKVIPKGSRLHRSIKTAGSQAGARAGAQAKRIKDDLQYIKTKYDQKFSSDASKRVVDVNAKVYKSTIDNAFSKENGIFTRNQQSQITDFTTGSLKTNSMFSRNYRPPNIMLTTGVEPTINWNDFGYTPGTEPTQVKKITIPELKTQVANSLNSFYRKTQTVVQTRYGTKASAKQIRNALKNQPQYWTNPVTQKIYRASYTTGLNKRYTLKPINRQYLGKQQSTAVQKQIEGQYQKKIKSDNIDLKKAHDDKYDILETELRSIQERLTPYDKGKAVKGLDYNNLVKRQNEINVEINNLEQGRWYSEHNVYLQSEKARNYVLDNSGVRINDSKEFQLGNVANQTPRLENRNNPDTLVFKELKDKLERVLDEAPDEYFSYPNYIVNSNPRLSGGREGIIRIEYSPIEWQPVPGTNNMRPVLTGFKVNNGILSGKSVIEIDTKDLDFIRNNLSTTEDIKNWLSSRHGINPVAQNESFPKEGFEIRLSKSPLVSRAEQVKQFQRLINDVQEGRKTWDQIFAEGGYKIVPQTDAAVIKKSQGGRPKGSPNKVKGEKGEGFLDLLKNTFYDRTE